jgi:hypothetical protein
MDFTSADATLGIVWLMFVGRKLMTAIDRRAMLGTALGAAAVADLPLIFSST